jgi:hypothetical protein
MQCQLKSAQHHWWPKSLSKYWADNEGCVNAIFADGKIRRAPPKQFGAINNAHHIKVGSAKVGSPWDCSFEGDFSKPDSQFFDLIRWLEAQDIRRCNASTELRSRIKPLVHSANVLQIIPECLASLAARSPATRERIRSSVSYFRREIGFEDDDDSLIAINQRDLYQQFLSDMRVGGRFAFIYSETSEFIYGDGFLHNFSTDLMHTSKPKAIIPLTPNISAIYQRPFSYYESPKVISVPVNENETAYFNDLIQIYSKDCVFFRSKKPAIREGFSDRQFRQLRYHRDPWLDCFLDELANFKTW